MPETAPRCAIFLMGPTGSGKTDLSLQLCERLPCEIVSVDSVLVYKGMDIGTAKPAPAVRRKVAHHLIDILDPRETYSAAAFRESALALIGKIMAAGKVPLLVGGTMFYFHALEQGLDDIPDVGDGMRLELDEEERTRGLAALYAELQRVDAATAVRLHPNDSQRIKRALEVYRVSGRALSEFQSGKKKRQLPFPVFKVGLGFADRAVLHAGIERRFDAMLAAGLVDEVSGLMLRSDLKRNLPSMRAVGYNQVWSYLIGECSREEMWVQAVSATRQLAKRQLTWMRSMEHIRRYEVDRIQSADLAATLITEIKAWGD